MTEIDEQLTEEHESIPSEVRDQVLEADNYRCQMRGCVGTQRGGTARLLVQLLDKSSVDEESIELEDCTTRCRRCSRWIAKMPTSEDLRPALKDRLNGVDIEPKWAEVLNYVDRNGPATPTEILEHVSLGSKPGVRFALNALLSLDIREPDIDDRILVKDRVNRTYGLPRQIPDDHYARGDIPVQPSERRNRILDEVALRLDNEISDEVEDSSATIARIVDRQPDQISRLVRRAEAFDFPFEDWAGDGSPDRGPATLIDAVSALANCSDNVSRQLLSSAIIDVFEANDEPELASFLNNWAQSNNEYRKQSSLPNQSADEKQPLFTESESENQETLDERLNRNDTSDQTGSMSPESNGNNLSSLSLADSESTNGSCEDGGI
jgi:hypothetical protein